MLTVEAPVREQTVIEIEPTFEQVALQRMVGMVEADGWTRNNQAVQCPDGVVRRCALGMVRKAISGNV